MTPISRSQNVTSLLQQRARGNSSSFINFKTDRMIQKLKNQTYTTTIFESILPHDRADYSLVGFDIKNQFIATIAKKSILKVWDVEEKICRWTFDPEGIEWSKVKIVGEQVICSGRIFNVGAALGTIRVFNLQTGIQAAPIKNARLVPETMWAIDRRIFCYLCEKDGNDCQIGEWNLEGESIRHIDLQHIPNSLSSYLSVTNGSVNIYPYDRQDSISSACVDMDRGLLICGHETDGNPTKPVCSAIDLKTGRIVNEYLPKELVREENGESFSIESYFPVIEEGEEGIVTAIVQDKKWIYLGYDNGKIVAIDLAQKNTIYLLGEHEDQAVGFLAADGQILISGTEPGTQPAFIKIWDTRSMTSICENKDLNSVNGIYFNSGKLSILNWNEIIEYDFSLSNRNEEFSEEFIRG